MSLQEDIVSYIIGALAVGDGAPVADIPWTKIKGKSIIRVPLKQISSGKFLFGPAADKFAFMSMAANTDGVALKINTAYRDVVYQGILYAAYEARGKTAPIVAKPGTSDHERGISLDIDTGGEGQNSPVYKWLAANASKYGFVNDVSSEPWHWTWKHEFVDKDIVTGGKLIRFNKEGKIESDTAVALMGTISEMGPITYLGIAAAVGGGWWLARPYLPGWAGGTRR